MKSNLLWEEANSIKTEKETIKKIKKIVKVMVKALQEKTLSPRNSKVPDKLGNKLKKTLNCLPIESLSSKWKRKRYD